MTLLDSLKDWFGVGLKDITALVLAQDQGLDGGKAVVIRNKNQIRNILTKYHHTDYTNCSDIPPAMWVYTKDFIYGISVYDCATSWFRVPRNPDTSIVPELVGGY